MSQEIDWPGTAKSIARDMVLLPGASHSSAQLERLYVTYMLLDNVPALSNGQIEHLIPLVVSLGAARFFRWAMTGNMTGDTFRVQVKTKE